VKLSTHQRVARALNSNGGIAAPPAAGPPRIGGQGLNNPKLPGRRNGANGSGGGNRGTNKAPGGNGGGAPSAPWYEGPNSEAEAKRTAAAEAGLATNPLISSIRGEERASRQRQRQIGEWYGQLNQQIGQDAAEASAASATANSALQKQLETANQGSLASQAQIGAQQGEFAKLVGAAPTAFTPTDQEGAAAGTQRAYAQAALSAPIIQAGASQGAFLRNQAANATHEGIFQRQQEANRRQNIKQDLQKAQQAKGEARVEDFNKLKEAAQKGETEKEAFGLKNKEFNTAQATAAQQAKIEAEERAEGKTQREIENRWKQRELNENKAAHENGGGLTPDEKATRHEAWTNAWHAAVALYEKKQWKNWGELQRALEKESEVSPTQAARAVAVIRKRYEHTAHLPGLF